MEPDSGGGAGGGRRDAHASASLPPPSHASGQKRKAKGGRKKTREKGMVALLGTAEEGSKEREREEARNCRNFPISHHVIVILLPILLLFPSSCSGTRQP